jgi:hypothetical protein
VQPFLLITDLDHTLVGLDTALEQLNQLLDDHRQKYGTRLVYSTGRSLSLYQQLATEKDLLEPDVLIASVGTEIYQRGKNQPDTVWAAKLAENWNRDEVVAVASHFSDLVPQVDSEQRPYKVSYFLAAAAAKEVIPRLTVMLGDRQLDTQLVYSGSRDLDILPRLANKGNAMTFIRQQFNIAPENAIACGDSGNDISMFAERSERGIIVGNAMPELLEWHYLNPNSNRYLAKAHCAAGILEGLQHFGFLAAQNQVSY